VQLLHTHRERLAWNDWEHLDADHRALIGVAACRREQIEPNEPTIRQALHALGEKGVGSATWRALKQAGILELAPLDEIERELDALIAAPKDKAGVGADTDEQRGALVEVVIEALTADAFRSGDSAHTAAVWIMASVLGVTGSRTAPLPRQIPALAGAPPG
jgi:hypothetical protein